MEKARQWTTGFGGLLSLVGLILCFIALAASSDRPAHLIWAIPDALRVSAPVIGPLFLGSGVLLVFISNESHPIGRWHQLVEGLQVPPSQLYAAAVEQVDSRGVRGMTIREVSLKQRGPLSAARKHVRVEHGYFRFDFYAMPIGTSLGVAWRCYTRMALGERVLRSFPIFGWIFYSAFFQYTSHVEDRGMMLQEAVRRSFKAAIDEISEQQGVRGLEESEYEPVVADMLEHWR